MTLRIICCALALAACGNEAAEQASTPGNAATTPARVNSDAMAEFGGGRVPLQIEACKAALAVLTGASPKDIEGGFVAGTLAEVSRRAPGDGLGRIRCRADTPSGLSWAAADAGQPRWNNADRVTFARSGETLKVVVSQGGTTREGSYPLGELVSTGQ